MSLFEDDPHDFREKLLDAYVQELLDNPPVRTLRPAEEPDAAKRQQNARAIALKDVKRVMHAVARVGITGDQLRAISDLYENEKR